jgi:glycosyltransferase involved in cell wall biosynthesis
VRRQAIDPEIAKIQAKLDQLGRTVADAQALIAAAYDRTENGEAKLAKARRDPRWQLAYTSPEPLVSIRIATRNRAELLVERALASVFRQTYANWEVVIAGSACTDDTEERIAALGDRRIRFRNLPVDGPYPEDRIQRWYVAGVPSMNAALRMAKGHWIAPLDDDDEWDDDHLEVLLDAALEARAEFAYGRLRAHLKGEPTGKEVGSWPPRKGQINLNGCLYNAALDGFEHDIKSRFLGEPHDWHLVRRMWEAGVHFAFVERTVATYHADHLQQIFDPDGAGS